jgi:hypothetical protein
MKLAHGALGPGGMTLFVLLSAAAPAAAGADDSPAPAGAQSPAPASAAAQSPAPAPSPEANPAADRGRGTAPPGAGTLRTTYDREFLRALPMSDSLWSIFETVDATAILDRMDNGGLYVGEPGLLGVRGSSWTQTAWTLGAFDVTDPDRIGTPLAFADVEALDAVDVAAGLSGAELRGSGPAVRLVPRTPGRTWSRLFEMNAGLPSLQQSPQRDGAPAIAHAGSLVGGRFRLDGPLRDDMGLLVSGSVTRGTRHERRDERALDGRAAAVLGHLVWARGHEDEHRFIAAVQDNVHPYAGRARFDHADIGQSNLFTHAQWTWEHRAARPFGVNAGFVRGSFDPAVTSASTTPVDRVTDGPMRLLFPGAGSRSRLGASGWMAPLPTRPALRVGAALALTGSSTRPAGPPGPTAELVAGLPARVWEYDWAGPVSRWRGTEISAYASDQVRYRQLVVDAGLRFETSSASAAGAAQGVRWSGVTPRLAARLRPFPLEQPGFSVFAGWGRYLSRLPLNLAAYGDPAAPQGLVYRWLDASGDGAYQPGERGPLIARVGPGGAFSSIDPDLGPPKVREVFVGFETDLRVFRLRGLGYHRRERDLVGSMNVGVPISAYDVFFVPDPGDDIVGAEDDFLLPIYNRRPETFGQDAYLLTRDPDKGTAKGVELEMELRLGKRFRMLAGGTASKTFSPASYRGFLASENDHGLVGERLEDPNAATLSKGRLFFERGYTLKFAITWDAPGGIRLGTVTRYQDGQHFARFVIPTHLNQGPEIVKAIYNGDSRFTYVLTIDALIEKSFDVRGKRVAALAEIFNFRGTGIEVEQDVVWGPSYRATSAVQPPRAVRLGLRVEY